MISTLSRYSGRLHTTRISNNVGDRHVLGIRAGVAAISTEFAWSESCHEGSCAVQSAVAISGIACDQFVRVAGKVDARFSDQVEESELVVCSIR
jgi:hypothetical protein